MELLTELCAIFAVNHRNAEVRNAATVGTRTALTSSWISGCGFVAEPGALPVVDPGIEVGELPDVVCEFCKRHLQVSVFVRPQVKSEKSHGSHHGFEAKSVERLSGRLFQRSPRYRVIVQLIGRHDALIHALRARRIEPTVIADPVEGAEPMGGHRGSWEAPGGASGGASITTPLSRLHARLSRARFGATETPKLSPHLVPPPGGTIGGGGGG